MSNALATSSTTRLLPGIERRVGYSNVRGDTRRKQKERWSTQSIGNRKQRLVAAQVGTVWSVLRPSLGWQRQGKMFVMLILLRFLEDSIRLCRTAVLSEQNP
jgi:hypothetical protein